MTRRNLIEQLHDWSRRHPDRSDIGDLFVHFVQEHEDCAHRSLLKGHLTASACVIDDNKDAMLLIEHRKLGFWLQPGGHADGELDLLQVALREVSEETGISAEPMTERIFDLDRHRIPARPGEPEHWHYDVRYLLQAPAGATPVGNEETRGARFVSFEHLDQLSEDDSVLRLARMATSFITSAPRQQA